MQHSIKTSLLVLLWLLIFCPAPSHAYLDPNTFSMVFQVIVAAIAGVAMFFKIGFGQIKAFFARIFNRQK
jgi:hypothetical protein